MLQEFMFLLLEYHKKGNTFMLTIKYTFTVAYVNLS